MHNNRIMDKVVEIIVDKLNVPAEEVVPSAHFANDLGADSLDQVELVMEFEKEFELDIKDDQATKLQTVGNVIKYLEEHLADG
ncbi:acyl carrier protein [Candidatus Cardinium hertigii]|uniref:Acyl carrier protein n=1 Tax=Candidatus Cardinium hertigii TaxID=247481 RepID=A0A3N2QD05_9BACT|nr:acyl carrier protein [Candidatus Cardinium hertigii]ROT47670.1 acyl carrier protein [Candidatus Cardinium hertigii]